MALHGPRMASGKSLLESSRHRKQKHPQLSVAGTVAPPHPVAVTLKMASPQAGGQEGPGQEGLDWRWQGKVALQNSLSPPQCVRSSVGCFVCLFVCLLHCVACVILVPGPGVKPGPPASALAAQGLNHWTAWNSQKLCF